MARISSNRFSPNTNGTCDVQSRTTLLPPQSAKFSMHPLAKHLLKVVGAGIGALFLLIALPILFFSLWLRNTPDLCADTEIEQTISPDHRHKAIAFRRDCGSTTDFTSHVVIVPVSGKLSDASSSPIALSGDSGQVHIRWLSPTRLRIEYPRNARVIRAENSYRGVEMEFSLIDYRKPGQS